MSSPGKLQADFCSSSSCTVIQTKFNEPFISEPLKSICCKTCREEVASEADTTVKQKEIVPNIKKSPEKWIVDLYKEACKEPRKSPSLSHQHPQTCKPLLEALSCVPKEEKEYMKEFQASIADGLALKQSIKTRLLSVGGVERVCVGFSTEKKPGYWPVIRVYPDEETCGKIKDLNEKEDFVKTLCIAIKKAVSLEKIKRFSDDCSHEEFATMIQIVVNYPIQAPLDLSSAGKEVTTTYTSHDLRTHSRKDWTQKGVMTCCVQNTISIGGLRRVAHYKVSGFHPVIPSNSQQFRSMLPQLPPNVGLHQAAATNDPVMLHEWVDDINPIMHVCYSARGPKNNPYQMPCLLQATLFPDRNKAAFQRMAEQYEYQCAINSSPHNRHHPDADLLINLEIDGPRPKQVKFLFGKSGLIKNNTKDGTYTHVMVEEEAHDGPSSPNDAATDVTSTGNPNNNSIQPNERDSGIKLSDHMHETGDRGNRKSEYIPFHSHPCNVDIAVFESTAHSQQQCISIEESFKNSISAEDHEIMLPAHDNIIWCGPPGDTFEDWTGSVVFINEGMVYKLSDSMLEFDPDYPGCIWEPAANEGNEAGGTPGDSGAPVFLWRGNTFHLIGILITKKHASPIGFSLQVMTTDIALHHCQQLLNEIESEIGQSYTVPASNPGEQEQNLSVDSVMIDCLRRYIEILEMYKNDQRLVAKLPSFTFSQLINGPFGNDKHIESDLKICYNPS